MDADALIAEIATRHGVAVSRDDPVMILATLNDLLAKENAEKQGEMLAQFRREMEAVSEKWASDAKARAQAILMQAQEINQAVTARQIEQAVRTDRAFVGRRLQSISGNNGAIEMDAGRQHVRQPVDVRGGLPATPCSYTLVNVDGRSFFGHKTLR